MGDNADQIAEWNGPQGEKWAELQAEFDVFVGRFGEEALAAAAPRAGEKVLDVGCGCGDTSLKLAQVVGASGSVTGVDVSKPMLAVAEQRRKVAGLDQLRFEHGDAAVANLPSGLDLVFSRFGVMFFDDPTAAFTHIGASVKPGGRMAFCCWRHPRENPWATATVVAAREALGVEAPPADLTLPGPFALSDPDRLKAILAQAGWRDVLMKLFDHAVRFGDDPRDAAQRAMRIGPVSRVLRQAGEGAAERALPAVLKAVEPFASADGVFLPSATWIVTASR